jgi:hypothetical protein
MDKSATSQASNICSRCNSAKSLGGKVLKPGECNVCVVAEDMGQAIGDVLIKHFPEAESGDVSPLVAFALDEAHHSLAREWIAGNVPGADHEDA